MGVEVVGSMAATIKQKINKTITVHGYMSARKVALITAIYVGSASLFKLECFTYLLDTLQDPMQKRAARRM